MRYAHEHPLRPSRTSLTGRVALDGRVHHIPDVLADPEYRLTEYQQVFGEYDWNIYTYSKGGEPIY